MAVLQSLQAARATAPAERDEIGFATARNTTGYYVLRARVPRALLARIGDPPRVRVRGKPQEGYVISPVPEAEREHRHTHAINYLVSAHAIYIVLPFKPSKLSKAVRRSVAVNASVRDGQIHTGGMPLGWIKAERMWTEKPNKTRKPPQQPANGQHHRVAAHAGNGTIPVSDPTAIIAKIVPDSRTVKALRHNLAVAIRAVADAKAQLEARTGLKLKISRDFRVLVDLEE